MTEGVIALSPLFSPVDLAPVSKEFAGDVSTVCLLAKR